MTATIHNPWTNKRTTNEAWSRKVEKLEQTIAQAREQIAYMAEQGLPTASMEAFTAKLVQRLAKLNAE